MAGGFSEPTPRQPKIPDAVPIERADPARQELYGKLIEADKEVREDAGNSSLNAAVVISEDIDPVELEAEPTDEDKRNFVRATLGGKDYSKTYKLFGEVDALFVDRSVELTERMYDQLAKDAGTLKIVDDEQWSVWLDRYQLAAVLRNVGSQKFDVPSSFMERAKDIMKMPRPMFLALLHASRVFEAHVDLMVQRTLDANFWQPGGPNSR